MRILLLCDDQYHPGIIPAEGIIPLKEKGFIPHVIYDAKDFDPATLKDYTVVIMSKCDHMTQQDSSPWKTAAIQDSFVQYVENGGGLLVTHSGTVKGESTHTLDALIGCHFAFHPADCPTLVDVIKPHPITRGVAPFTEVDEHYHLTITARDADIFLASYASPQGEEAKYASEPYFNAPAAIRAAGYTRTQGKGRVCVLTPGHTPAVWRNPNFVRLLENASRWCAGHCPDHLKDRSEEK
ncbi:MAG: ThuA domain-containing protein [Defluviitaleaceae bacterium]|nr:ThuA domain-containing protein [Defluviitaleaceae bacterium]MCL2240618.1 ThuA domain-containing protein [Defluviitaleaceae bacterium]